jgi:lysophospholipase L1-like esterase
MLLFGLYVGVVSGAAKIPGLSDALRTSAPEPPPEVMAQNHATQEKIATSLARNSAFYLELTDEELTALLVSRTDLNNQVRDLKVHTTPDEITFSGSLNGVIGVPCSGAVDVLVERGEIRLELTRASVGALGVPGGTQQEIESVINSAIDLDELFRQYGATQVQQVRLEEGKTIVVGVQRVGTDVSERVRGLMQVSVGITPRTAAPVPPGGDLVPPGAVVNKTGDELYLALGDSLAANVGVVDGREGYVSRFHGYLERQTGRPLGLVNLGIPGESSISFFKGQLGQALNEIQRRRDDGSAATKVSVVTLDLGANDLLGHLTSGDCLNSPSGRACQDRMDAGLATFKVNFREIVPVIAGSLEPDTEFYIMTVYNPFGLGTDLPLEDLSNETVDELNKVIREVAEEHQVPVADPRPIMDDNAGFWTHILAGDIHPNDKGYQVLAYSLAKAREEQE